MHIKQAQMTDLDKIIEILADGKNQLAERGIDQWQGDYPSRQHVKEDIAAGFAYLVESDDHETVGTLAIVTAPDPCYDELKGEWQVKTDKYLTIHRVAIHSNHAGKGYATRLLTATINYIVDHRTDILSLRIDTNAKNEPMQYLIKKVGFTKIGELHGVYHVDEISYVYELDLEEARRQRAATNAG